LKADYKTTDTALAAYIITLGHVPRNIDYDQPRFEFTFKSNSVNIDDFATKYITGNALVDPATYNRVYRKLLRIVRNHLQWGEE
jgi:hypothetical protein